MRCGLGVSGEGDEGLGGVRMSFENTDVEDACRLTRSRRRSRAEVPWEAAEYVHRWSGGGAARGEVIVVRRGGRQRIFQRRALVGCERALRRRIRDCVLFRRKGSADDCSIRSESGGSEGTWFDCSGWGLERR